MWERAKGKVYFKYTSRQHYFIVLIKHSLPTVQANSLSLPTVRANNLWSGWGAMPVRLITQAGKGWQLYHAEWLIYWIAYIDIPRCLMMGARCNVTFLYANGQILEIPQKSSPPCYSWLNNRLWVARKTP